MEINEILCKVDHTLLSQNASFSDIRAALDDGIHFHTASVCIPPCFVRRAKEYVKGQISVGTVVGFPFGYSTTSTKVYETYDALSAGADEIDMVINVGAVKDGDYRYLEQEIRLIKQTCGDHILKVILETCLLTEQEKIEMCRVVTESGADFIKTSTGFSTGGATKEDILLFKKHVGSHVKIKAAGGISTIEDAADYLALGCSRLGTSRIIKILKQELTQKDTY